MKPANRGLWGEAMKSLILKRSVVIGGHKTSVSLEKPFWEGLKEIAETRETGLSDLLRSIDRERDNANLSSAIRVFVFEHFRALALAETPRHAGGHVASTFVSDDNAVTY
jgi:predicted DNA-binding ribbon-helix-helix protein